MPERQRERGREEEGGGRGGRGGGGGCGEEEGDGRGRNKSKIHIIQISHSSELTLQYFFLLYYSRHLTILGSWSSHTSTLQELDLTTSG